MDLDAQTQLTDWALREGARIKALSEDEVIIEITNAMNGENYSWRSIKTRMERLDPNSTLYLDWSSLWILKKKWEDIPSTTNRGRQNKPSTIAQSNASHSKTQITQEFRILLVKLKLVTARAGLGKEGKSDLD